MTVPTIALADGYMEAPDTDSWISETSISKSTSNPRTGTQCLRIYTATDDLTGQDCLHIGENHIIKFSARMSYQTTVRLFVGDDIVWSGTVGTSWQDVEVELDAADVISESVRWSAVVSGAYLYLDAVEIYRDPRRTERAVSHVASQFQAAETGAGQIALADLITALTAPAASIDASIMALLNRRGLDCAIGVWLDLIGRIIGADRFKKEYDNDVLFEFGETYSMFVGTVLGTDTSYGTWNGPNTVIATRFIAATSSYPGLIQIYSISAGNVKFAVYDDNNGEPGDRLAYDNTPHSCLAGRWNEFELPNCLVTAGEPYWIVAINDTSGSTVRGSTGTTRTQSGLTFSTFSWPTTGAAWTGTSNSTCSYKLRANRFVPDFDKGFADTAQTTGGRLYGVNGAPLPSGELIDDPDYISLLRAKASVSFQPSSIKSCVDFVYNAFGVDSWVEIDSNSDWTLYLDSPITVAQRRYLTEYAPVPVGSSFSIGNWPT